MDVIGIYLIWHEGVPSRVVKIGRGNIAERLSELQRDPEILAYSRKGKLRVTWASAPAAQLEGILHHLKEKWRPPVLTLYAEVEAIEANSPWTETASAEIRLRTPLLPRAAGR